MQPAHKKQLTNQLAVYKQEKEIINIYIYIKYSNTFQVLFPVLSSHISEPRLQYVLRFKCFMFLRRIQTSAEVLG